MIRTKISELLRERAELRCPRGGAAPGEDPPAPGHFFTRRRMLATFRLRRATRVFRAARIAVVAPRCASGI